MTATLSEMPEVKIYLLPPLCSVSSFFWTLSSSSVSDPVDPG